MRRSIAVALADRSYEVAIGPGLIAEAGARLGPFLKRPLAAVVADTNLQGLHGEVLTQALQSAGIETSFVVIAPGEAAKSFAGLADLCQRLVDLELDRGDVIVAFGGGVIGDLAGFAAAIFKRGIDFIQIPSTLLAQVDSSVGGKTAIDMPQGKNLIGAFHHPKLVLADLDLLSTLPAREIACGYAEIVKCALLADADFFAWLEAHGGAVLALGEALAEAVARAVAIKAKIVEADEREGGARALLNLGHTFAHAIEAETGFDEAVKHGEAVALGCALAFRLSAELGHCSDDEADRAAAAMDAAGLPTRLADLAGGAPSAKALVAHMAQDKKSHGGALNLVLARRIGEAFVAKDIDPARLEAFLVAEGAAP